MPVEILNAPAMKGLLQECVNAYNDCGFEAYVVMKEAPRLRRICFYRDPRPDGSDFRASLKQKFFAAMQEQYLSDDVEYADGRYLADNQNKNLIIKQSGDFVPFAFLNNENADRIFSPEDLDDAMGLVFRINSPSRSIWLYQHMWSIMVPNKKKNNTMARISRYENHFVFSEQKEQILTIAPKVDILIIDDYLVTNNPKLLQSHFGFQTYIYQAANNSIQEIVDKNLVDNTDKLTEYISRGKPQYAKKMMRIGSSKVFSLTKEQLLEKVNSLDRWKDKFVIDADSQKIQLRTYRQVESLIDLFDERYTRSDVTDAEYDTDVKKLAP